MRYHIIPIMSSIMILLAAPNPDASLLYSVPLTPPADDARLPWQDNVQGNGKDKFDAAIKDYIHGRYDQALQGFESIREQYPGSDAAAVSTLYEGSIYFRMAVQAGEKDSSLLMNALDLFKEGIRSYPASDNAAKAILETGKIYLEMDFIVEARGSFKRVVMEYASTRYAAEAQYLLAITSTNEGKYKEALDQYKIFAANYPGEMEREILFNKANIFLHLQEFGEAKRLYDTGLRKWPAYLKGHPGRLSDYSECQFQNGDLSKAREGFLTLYNLYPENRKAGIALNRVGDTYMLERKADSAETIYMDVIELFPGTEAAFLSRLAIGDIKFSSNPEDVLHQEAIKYYKEVEELSDNKVLVSKARFRLSKVLASEGKFRKALDTHVELLETTDESFRKEVSHSFHEIIGIIGREIKEKIGRREYFDAVRIYQEYYESILGYIPDEVLLMEIAEAHNRLRLYHAATDIYREIIDRNGSEKGLALFKSGEIYSHMGDDGKVVDILGSYIAGYPGGERVTNAMVLVGESLFNLEKYESAAGYFFSVIRKAPYHYPSAYIRVSDILSMSGRHEDSVKILSDMTNNSTDKTDDDLLARAHIALGNAYYKSGSYKNALAVYRKVLSKFDLEDETEIVELMAGDCLLKLDRRDDANRIFTRLSERTTGLIRLYSLEMLKDIELNSIM